MNIFVLILIVIESRKPMFYVNSFFSPLCEICSTILSVAAFLFIIQFNFVGKLLGPKGNSMKRLQEETMCKMAVLGRGSMKDRKKVCVWCTIL